METVSELNCSFFPILEFQFVHEIIKNKKATKVYKVYKGDRVLKYSEILQLLDENEEFRSYLTETLRSCGYVGYTWEAAPTSKSLVQKTSFEFAIVESNSLDTCAADLQTFSEYFNESDNKHVISFYNLGKDAMLISPLPNETHNDYSHLGRFLKTAPEDQIHSLWQEVSHVMRQQLYEKENAPLWLSTAGHGVSWLHVRVDTYPKYYTYAPFREPPKINNM